MFTETVDSYVRSNDTLASKIIKRCSPVGPEYLTSWQKRIFDICGAITLALPALPVVATLAALKVIEDFHSPIFIHNRIRSIADKTDIGIIKLRCFRPNSDKSTLNDILANNKAPWEDPRCTKLGAIMRRFQLEELPQLAQVLIGDLSLIGTRSITDYEVDRLQKKWSLDRFSKWAHGYDQCQGITGLEQIIKHNTSNKTEKNDLLIDSFYNDHASLGLDFYITFKTIREIFRI